MSSRRLTMIYSAFRVGCWQLLTRGSRAVCGLRSTPAQYLPAKPQKIPWRGHHPEKDALIAALTARLALADAHLAAQATHIAAQNGPHRSVGERHLRPSVIFRKETNGFRCEWGRNLCRLPIRQWHRESLGV